jgi:PhnB protein
MQPTPYIFFDGNCAEALKFYEKVLGAKTEMKMTYGESPAAAHMPASAHGNIIHARFRIGDGAILASDWGAERPIGKAGRFSLTINADKAAEAERIFRDLSDGGEVTMAMDKTFFAERFGSATDKFGIPWMVICEKEG